jgi:aromatic ring-opening dioxygenase catalytic subunit (LigB family)
MFGEDFRDEARGVPIVQISIDGSLKPEKEIALGNALKDLRCDRIFVLSCL